MNKTAETAAKILGSAWVIVPFGIWMVIHGFMSKDYVATISDLAIWIGFLILRAESVQGDRTERLSRKDLRATKRIEKKLK